MFFFFGGTRIIRSQLQLQFFFGRNLVLGHRYCPIAFRCVVLVLYLTFSGGRRCDIAVLLPLCRLCCAAVAAVAVVAALRVTGEILTSAKAFAKDVFIDQE